MSGTGDKIKGKTKEAVGDLTDDRDLEREGKMDHAGGVVKDKADDAKDWVGRKVDDAKDALKRD